jgi:hypothetical protein
VLAPPPFPLSDCVWKGASGRTSLKGKVLIDMSASLASDNAAAVDQPGHGSYIRWEQLPQMEEFP